MILKIEATEKNGEIEKYEAEAIEEDDDSWTLKSEGGELVLSNNDYKRVITTSFEPFAG